MPGDGVVTVNRGIKTKVWKRQRSSTETDSTSKFAQDALLGLPEPLR